jgi:acyl-CoA synthetase (AMP-forming)/AMP-acid ligase II
MIRLHDFLDYRTRESPNADLLAFAGRRLSYRDGADLVERIARAFAGAGLRKGDRIAVLGKNGLEYPLLFYGASKAGVVPVPLNYRLAPPEWSYILRDAGAKLLLAEAPFAQALANILAEVTTLRERVVLPGAGPSTDVPSGWRDFRGWLADRPAVQVDVDITPEDDLYQMYTSGTTGRPKGAVLTHRAVAANIFQSLFALPSQAGERSLIVAPLYHAAAALMTFNTVAQGGSLFVMEDFDPVEVVRAIAEERIGRALLVPAMIQACLAMVPDVASRSYPDLHSIVYGASPISEQTLRRALEVFQCEFIQGYGMTETTAVLTYLMPEDHRRALAGEPELLLSCGRPIVGTEVKVVDASDREVPPGAVGEIVASGPQIMRGYWNLPEATAEALRGGRMHTGDAARCDERGYLFIQDRIKDMIVSGGENVYPREVEEVLFGHPGVADAAVIGVPDEQWGESVKAIVVLRSDAAATAEEIVEFCKGRLGGYKRPRSVEFVASLPRNPSGKVLKRELREPYWQGRARRVS